MKRLLPAVDTSCHQRTVLTDKKLTIIFVWTLTHAKLAIKHGECCLDKMEASSYSVCTYTRYTTLENAVFAVPSTFQ
jgi:hypothetical protein